MPDIAFVNNLVSGSGSLGCRFANIRASCEKQSGSRLFKTIQHQLKLLSIRMAVLPFSKSHVSPCVTEGRACLCVATQNSVFTSCRQWERVCVCRSKFYYHSRLCCCSRAKQLLVFMAGRRAMAANISDASYADRPQPVDKTDAQIEIWHCFAYVADTRG